jgi:radical SAM/Cys-rich protein
MLLMATQTELRILPERQSGPDFGEALSRCGAHQLTREEVRTLQINVGKLCNQACHHCHVEAGPKRTEIMPREVAERILDLLSASPNVQTVDITGGAPELNPSFRTLVQEAATTWRQVIDRCNLTVFFEAGQEDLPEFLASNRVEITASLPCYSAENVDQQRGRGVFDKSIRALERLNAVGYGREETGLVLNLVYNPLGAFLPPPQQKLETDYKKQLGERFGISFNRLLTITNMPIKRFADFLTLNHSFEAYMGLLVNHFNPLTIPHLMCRSLVSVGWDGQLYDCDFNQMVDLKMPGAKTIWHVESFAGLGGKRIATGSHCFGCTAGAGSGCGGALE